MKLQELRDDIAAATQEDLAGEVVESYEELRARHFRRDFRPGLLEAGRFAEAVFRVLQVLATGKCTPVGKTLPKLPQLLVTLENADAGKVHESVRLHIPRALATVYNMRNKRDIGHIAADVDANVMDAEFAVASCNWVLAELVRLLHRCSPEDASVYVEKIVERRAPLVQVFGDEPFVLSTELSAKDEILVLLYQRGESGATLDDLDRWTPNTIGIRSLSARMSELENRDRFIRRLDGRAFLTESGAHHIESVLSSKSQ